jgi:hypothetical protein
VGAGGRVDVRGHASVAASDGSFVLARDFAIVTGRGDVIVQAWGFATVFASDGATVQADGWAEVWCDDEDLVIPMLGVRVNGFLRFEPEDADAEGDEGDESCPICESRYRGMPEHESDVPRCEHWVARSDYDDGFSDGPLLGMGARELPPYTGLEDLDDIRVRRAFSKDQALAVAVYAEGFGVHGSLHELYRLVGEMYAMQCNEVEGSSAIGWSYADWFCERRDAFEADLVAAAARLSEGIGRLNAAAPPDASGAQR